MIINIIGQGSLAKINYNNMNKGLIPVLTLATVSNRTANQGSLAYFLKKYLAQDKNIIERAKLVQIIITLRKHIFSTLRQIAYVANCIKIMESGIEPRKIKDIIMKDGASAQKRLQTIQDLVLLKFQVSRQKFQSSCNFHSYNDIQVKMLLTGFQNDIQNAIDGTIQSYNGPLPKIGGPDTIRIYREIVLRRMRLIQQKFLNNLSDIQCIKQQFEIQLYLEGQNITNPKEPNQKVFISLLQYHYKNDYQFKQQFQELQKQFDEFIEEVRKKKQKKL